ncbi:MAG: hypothetical protein ACRCSV_04420, partial [Chlamydiales bacterium]
HPTVELDATKKQRAFQENSLIFTIFNSLLQSELRREIPRLYKPISIKYNPIKYNPNNYKLFETLFKKIKVFYDNKRN